MRKPLLWILILLVVALVGLRLYLPYYLRDYVERTLDAIPEYDSRLKSVEVHLWRGAYAINDLALEKTSGKVPVPFFSCARADLSVKWSAIWDGALVGELDLRRPQLNFVSGPSEAQEQTGADESWQDRVKELFPLRFDRFRIRDGELHYRDFNSEPKVDVYIQDIAATATNLTNSKDISESLVAELKASGTAQQRGRLQLEVKLDPLNEIPTFDLNGRLEDLPLPELNDFLRAYGNFDVERGTFDLYAELAAADGKFRGYLKPFLDNVKVGPWKSGKPLKIAWESLVAGVLELLEDSDKDAVATQIPVRGSFEDPEPDLWAAIGEMLRHAFIRSLFRGLDDSVDMRDVEGEGEKGEEDD